MKNLFIILSILITSCLNASEKLSLNGFYMGINKQYNESIYFYNKNKFYYSVNLCQFRVYVAGIYEIDGEKILCRINKRNFGKGWPEEKINTIKLNLKNTNNLLFKTYFGCDHSKNKLFKKSKPIIKKSLVENLRVRTYYKVDSTIIKSLRKGEKVEVLNKFNSEVINKKKGSWVLVKTIDNKFGYCFDAYLQ